MRLREAKTGHVRVVGAHAPWQHGCAERNGGILGTIWNKMVKQFGIEGHSSVKFLLNLCTQAKNATLMRNGMSPEQAVLGRSLRWSARRMRTRSPLLPLGQMEKPGWQARFAQRRGWLCCPETPRTRSDELPCDERQELWENLLQVRGSTFGARARAKEDNEKMLYVGEDLQR